MYREHSVGVVIPCFNEGTQIENVLATMPDYVDHIVVVDDRSKDDTVEKVKNYIEQKDNRVILIEHEKNQGVGGAIASGYKWMRDNDVDTATVMAGDGQMSPKDLPSLLDPVVEDKCDYAKGNRLVWDNAYHTIPRVRFLGNAALSFLTKIASGYWHVADSQTGYTVINKRALKVVDWDDMYKRYGQPNDLLVKLNIHNFRVKDVPIEPVYNVGEQSGIRVRKVVFSIGWLLIKLFGLRMKEKYIIRDFHPLILFMMFGLFMGVTTAVMGVRFFYLWFSSGNIPEITMLTFLFCFSIAFNSLFFAFWMDAENNRDLKGD